MKIEILGLSLQMSTLQPILIIQVTKTKEQYSIPLSLEEAILLANYFYSKEKNILLEHKEISEQIRLCHKNIERASLVFSPEGSLTMQMHVTSWFRKKYLPYSLMIGLGIALYYDISIYASHTLLTHITKTKQVELQRVVDATRSSLETLLLYDAISTEKTFLGMRPETTLIM